MYIINTVYQERCTEISIITKMWKRMRNAAFATKHNFEQSDRLQRLKLSSRMRCTLNRRIIWNRVCRRSRGIWSYVIAYSVWLRASGILRYAEYAEAALMLVLTRGRRWNMQDVLPSIDLADFQSWTVEFADSERKPKYD